MLFMLFGLKAGLVYGGLVGVMTASSMLGHAIAGELMARIIVAGGMLMGVLTVGSMMTITGALTGMMFDLIVLRPVESISIFGNAC